MSDKADLHIHTTYSDGQLSPVEVIKLAAEKKLTSVAITDHDTFEAYAVAKPFADEAGLELIPGVEITTMFNGRESHILAYYFETDTNYFTEFLANQKRSRTDRIKVIVEILQNQKIEIEYSEVWAQGNGANLGRPHIAKVLIDKGYVSSITEAFNLYLSNEKLGEVNNSYSNSEEVIQMIKNVGGAAILAHPGRFYSNEEVEEFIELGIDGIECIHPSHNWKKQLKFVEFCEKHNLLKTGGSDYHGSYDNANAHVGIVTIAQKHVSAMKRMTNQRKQTILVKE